MPKIYAIYVGAGGYVDGVPACDLTQDEWDALSDEMKAHALAAGTHEIKSPRKNDEQTGEITDG